MPQLFDVSHTWSTLVALAARLSWRREYTIFTRGKRLCQPTLVGQMPPPPFHQREPCFDVGVYALVLRSRSELTPHVGSPSPPFPSDADQPRQRLMREFFARTVCSSIPAPQEGLQEA